MKMVSCKFCNKEFGTYPSILKKGKGKFCSTACSVRFYKPHKGHKHSFESRLKMSKSHTGKKQGYEQRMKKAQKGEKHWNWKGGISSLRKRLMGMTQYKEWRSSIFNRDDYTCVLCCKRGGNLEADHYPIPYVHIRNVFSLKTVEDALSCELLWNKENGRTLCKNCHNENKIWKNLV